MALGTQVTEFSAKAKYFLIATLLSTVFSGLVLAAELQATEGPAPAGRYLRLLSASGEVTTSSTSFEDLLDMTAVFSTRGKGSCITATFSGELFNQTGPGTFAFRALLDGTLMEGHGSDGDVSYVNETGHASMASYTFWACDISSGSHTLTMQWRVGGVSGEVGIDGRTLIIEGR